MALVRLRPPLSELAGGRREIGVEGDSVAAVLRGLEHEHPPLVGWILDEHGRIRPHVNVFVNKERGECETPVRADDLVHVLPAISGGAR